MPRGSCHLCSGVTSAFEGTVQRTMLGPLRLMFDLPSRRKRDRPVTLKLKVRRRPGDDWSLLDVDRRIYPFLVVLPILDLPDAVSRRRVDGPRHAAATNYWIRAGSLDGGFSDRCERLAAELGVAEIMPTASSDAEAFFRMLAKIAHAFAFAELGPRAFEPWLLPMIRDGETANARHFVGGLGWTEPPSVELHQVWIASYPPDPALLTVRIRLLASLETPTYVVAVGLRNVEARP